MLVNASLMKVAKLYMHVIINMSRMHGSQPANLTARSVEVMKSTARTI